MTGRSWFAPTSTALNVPQPRPPHNRPRIARRPPRLGVMPEYRLVDFRARRRAGLPTHGAWE